MKKTKRLGLGGLVLTTSILLIGAGSGLAEPGPFENFFHRLRRAFNEPQHKSAHRSSRKQTDETGAASGASSTPANTPHTSSGGVSVPPNEGNTRTAIKATRRKGEDLSYGMPVPGKNGFVTSPYSPEAGYIDVRGFAPGTPVKDPYTGKIFLTP